LRRISPYSVRLFIWGCSRGSNIQTALQRSQRPSNRESIRFTYNCHYKGIKLLEHRHGSYFSYTYLFYPQMDEQQIGVRIPS
jgi:hypothetical protein